MEPDYDAAMFERLITWPSVAQLGNGVQPARPGKQWPSRHSLHGSAFDRMQCVCVCIYVHGGPDDRLCRNVGRVWHMDPAAVTSAHTTTTWTGYILWQVQASSVSSEHTTIGNSLSLCLFLTR